jgi:hypothetical protein
MDYHTVRAAQVAGIITFVNMNGRETVAGTCKTFGLSREWCEVRNHSYLLGGKNYIPHVRV